MTARLVRYLGRHHWGIIATFIALGGTAYAASELPPNSVGSRQLKTGAVTLRKISRGAQATLHRPRGHAGGDLIGTYPNPTLAAPPPEVPVTYNRGQAIAASGGWRALGSGYAAATYWRDLQRVVHLAGVSQSFNYVPIGAQPPQNLCTENPLFPVSSGLPSNVMFTLPPGYRPATPEIFAVDSGNAEGRVDVDPNGQVICMSGAGDQYVSLDGISFRAGG